MHVLRHHKVTLAHRQIRAMGHAERVNGSCVVCRSVAGTDRMRCDWWSGPGMVAALPVARVCKK